MINKFAGFFNPDIVKKPIHIIGCGAIGSTLALQLARCGIIDISLWDFDTVEQHNLANQQFHYKHIGFDKTEALEELILAINPHAKVTKYAKYTDEQLDGYVFMAVDNIDTRKEIVIHNKYNVNLDAMFDFRMRLKDAQHFGADWMFEEHKENLLNTMDFTQAEADEQTPVNACGMSLSIIPTVETVVAVGVANFINYLHDAKTLKKFIMVNPFDY